MRLYIFVCSFVRDIFKQTALKIVQLHCRWHIRRNFTKETLVVSPTVLSSTQLELVSLSIQIKRMTWNWENSDRYLTVVCDRFLWHLLTSFFISHANSGQSLWISEVEYSSMLCNQKWKVCVLMEWENGNKCFGDTSLYHCIQLLNCISSPTFYPGTSQRYTDLWQNIWSALY